MNPPATTRKRLTLVDLDKRCGARKAPPRARASAAALGADVLAQIDLLRGRLPGARKRGIAALLDVPTRKRTKNGSATVRAYDVGAPIQVAGSSAAFSVSLATETASWRSFAYRADDDPVTTGFTVEVYEEDPQRTARAPEPVAPAPIAPPGEPPIIPAVVLPVAATPAPPQTEVPVAAALSAGQREDGFLGLDLSAAAASDREDAEQFEREIQAILSGKTTRPVAQSAPASGAAPPPPAAAPAPRPHDIFEQMGQNMAYATSFNLPPMELGRRFDDLEREIALEEQAQERKPSTVSLELSDDDISQSLGLARALKDVTPPVTPAPPELLDQPRMTVVPVAQPALTEPPFATAPPVATTPVAAPGSEAVPAITTPTPVAPQTASPIAATPPPASGPDAPAAPPVSSQTPDEPPAKTHASQPAPDGRSKP